MNRLQKASHTEATVARGNPGAVAFTVPARRITLLPPEPRRALALLRALDLSGDSGGLRALLTLSGSSSPAANDQRPEVGESQVQAVAKALRERGYPLTDDGIRVFKMERGFSSAVRIGADVASAYARLADGLECRLNVDAETWATSPIELRRAIELLMLIGRRPAELLAVREALGVRDSERTPRGVVLVGRITGERLLGWSHALDWSFDSAGLARIARAAGLDTKVPDEAMASFVADAVLARGEPEHDYHQVRRGHFVLNRRTVTMLRQARACSPDRELHFAILKGSYEIGDTKGAHPHQGGGVVDLSVRDLAVDEIEHSVRALRLAGFAAWFRQRANRPHIHAVAIGDREMSPSAAWQVKAYFAGRDGRSFAGPDPHAALPVSLPAWVAKYRVRFLG